MDAAPESEIESLPIEVSIVIPCLDEAETLAACVLEARTALVAAGATGEVLVADNGSRDGSPALAVAAGARVVHVPAKGYGNALLGGITAARGRYVLMGDADGSYDFGALPGFLERLRAGAELVMGCRLPGGGGTILPGAMPWKHRWIGNPLLSIAGRLLFTAPVHDFHCGLRACRREAVLRLGLGCPGMEFASEMVVKATLAGFAIAEVPVTLRPDRRSHPPHLRSWQDGWRHLRLMLLLSPTWLFLAPGAAVAAVSLLAFLLLAHGPVTLGDLRLDTNTMLVAGLGLTTGVQTLLFGLVARMFAARQGLLPPSPLTRWLGKRRPVQLGIVSGGALALLGLGHLAWGVELWRRAGFGDLSYPDSLRIVVPAVVALALAAQLVFAGFTLAVLELSRENPDRPPALSPGRTRLLTVTAVAPLLLWPTLLNTHPYLFWDSYGYFTQGRDYWQLIGAWLGLAPVPPEAAAGWIGAAGRMLRLDPAIRSMSYSLLFWPIAVLLDSFWLTVALNALAAAYTVDVALERLFGLALRHRLLAFAALLCLSSLPWFASYVMPDLFGGLMLLALAALGFAWDRLARSQRLVLGLIAALGASFHAANLPLALLLVVAGALLAPVGRLAAGIRLAMPLLAAVVLLSLLGWLGFGRPSVAPKSPPFLLARQVEDGPTVPYLREHCGQEDWALCPHLDELWPNAQDFLWSEVRSYWAWEDLRDRLRAEEGPLVLRAALARPWLQLRASAGNTLRQLAKVGLADFVLGRGALIRPEDYWFTYFPDVPAKRYGLGGFSIFLEATTVASLGLLLWLAWRRGLDRAVWFLLLGVLLNAAVCGVLSGPNHRYQARVAWLLPLAAAALLLRRREAAVSRSRPAGTPPDAAGARSLRSPAA